MIKYVYNKIDDYNKKQSTYNLIYALFNSIFLLYTIPTAHDSDPIGVQEIIQNISIIIIIFI